MTEFNAGQFDIAVIGAGHAGIEAALAAWSGSWTPWGARWRKPPTRAASSTVF